MYYSLLLETSISKEKINFYFNKSEKILRETSNFMNDTIYKIGKGRNITPLNFIKKINNQIKNYFYFKKEETEKGKLLGKITFSIVYFISFFISIFLLYLIFKFLILFIRYFEKNQNKKEKDKYQEESEENISDFLRKVEPITDYHDLMKNFITKKDINIVKERAPIILGKILSLKNLLPPSIYEIYLLPIEETLSTLNKDYNFPSTTSTKKPSLLKIFLFFLGILFIGGIAFVVIKKKENDKSNSELLSSLNKKINNSFLDRIRSFFQQCVSFFKNLKKEIFS